MALQCADEGAGLKRRRARTEMWAVQLQKKIDPRPDYSPRKKQKQANNRPELTTNKQLTLPNDQM